MNAHRMVIIAAALTVVVAAALATALAAFSEQALPRAVRHDLSGASGTALVIIGNVNASQGAQYTSQLPGMISSALAGTPFAFYHAYWSDPLEFVPGSRPAQPSSAGNQLRAEAAVLGSISAHAVLISGHWPGAPLGGQPVPAALPASAAALLHVTDGDTLRMKDGLSGHYVRFVVTGLYRPQAGVVAVLEPQRDRAHRVQHGQRLHHLRPAGRAGRSLRRASRGSRGADRQPGFLAGPAADGERPR
jgi:hypothetical protein